MITSLVLFYRVDTLVVVAVVVFVFVVVVGRVVVEDVVVDLKITLN